MQDLNNENTHPTRLTHGTEETIPSRVQHEPVVPTPEEAPVSIDVPSSEVTRPMNAFTGASAVESTAVQQAPDLPPPPELPVPPPPVPPVQQANKPLRARRWPWILLGILMIFLFAGAGSWMGYRSAIQLRMAKMEEGRVKTATDHFMIGLVAQTNKQYEIAKQQFEYVILLDPNFPGAQDKLREVLIAMTIKATPTLAPTVAAPTMTPTKDTRPQEEIFNQARQQIADKQWDAVFATVDSLRRVDPNYRAVDVDGMLYIALRYRGIDKIIHQANLEGGLYDLALAEKFGPLDVDAKGYRNWARLYLNGASFWEVDWQKVMQAFEQIYPYFPNMRDSSGLTASERYRLAAKNYGDQLLEKNDACGAYDNYKKSLAIVADAALEKKADEAYLVCHPPTAVPTITLTPVPATAIPTVETVAPPPAQITPSPEVTTTSGGGSKKPKP